MLPDYLRSFFPRTTNENNHYNLWNCNFGIPYQLV